MQVNGRLRRCGRPVNDRGCSDSCTLASRALEIHICLGCQSESSQFSSPSQTYLRRNLLQFSRSISRIDRTML
jgi:hypothetical protein